MKIVSPSWILPDAKSSAAAYNSFSDSSGSFGQPYSVFVSRSEDEFRNAGKGPDHPIDAG